MQRSYFPQSRDNESKVARTQTQTINAAEAEREGEKRGPDRREESYTREAVSQRRSRATRALRVHSRRPSRVVEFSSWNSVILASSFPGNAAEFVVYADVNDRCGGSPRRSSVPSQEQTREVYCRKVLVDRRPIGSSERHSASQTLKWGN